MKKLNLRFCFFTFIAAIILISCEQKCEGKLLGDHPIFLEVIDSLDFENVQFNECLLYYPMGTIIF